MESGFSRSPTTRLARRSGAALSERFLMARLLYRLGAFSARHRIAFLIGWLVALGVLVVTALTGMRFSDGSFDVQGTESSRALTTVQEDFPSGPSDSSLQLVTRAEAGAISDPAHAQDLQTALQQIRDLPHVTSVSDPLDPTNPRVSGDGSTAVATVTVEEVSEHEADRVHQSVVDVAKTLRADGFDAEVGGTLANPIPQILGPTEIVGALLAFGVLVLTFGSLVAAGANMAGALLGVGVGILGVLAASVVHPIGSTTPILAVMLGLAVGIDYCLFVIARFRSELLAGRDVLDAIGRATGTAGSSVVFAAATVIIALAGLSLVGISFITEMGLAAAFAVLVAVLMTLTFLPGLLAGMGHRALSRRDRRRLEAGRAYAQQEEHTHDSHDESHQTAREAAHRASTPGFLRSWVLLVTRRPIVSALSAIVVLLVAAVPVLSLSTTLNNPGGEDPDSTQRAAYDLIAKEFGAGFQDPLVVLAEGDAAALTPSLPQVQKLIAGVEGVASVTPALPSADGAAALLQVVPTTGPLDERTRELVLDLREHAADVPGVRLSVTGATALGLDSDQQLRDALATYLVVVVGLALLLLIVMFRSILVPVIATLGFLLSLGAGIGAAVAVFQWGWLDAVIPAPQGNPLLSLLPIILTGILFGLAMDYQVFLVSRMHEAHVRGASPRQAIIDGFSRSAPVVVAAASIMAAVFGGFALSHSSLVASIALGLAVGVIADAFLVRMIFVPATLALLGRTAWWMPRWLERVLPHLDTEGLSLEDAEHRLDHRPDQHPVAPQATPPSSPSLAPRGPAASEQLDSQRE
ncbi:putative membrane transport protein [Kineococcus radiotolerans SRS30216 = ATCC BAA-149]|uniref:Membrane transport protein n=2 Tax=Kineococcus radiotolerans TaxID=131568 RepID=A6WB22_KINRD|nr:putative membrane transport protein [Kineococcus radiotolerans SRS30216 = ATCC BAA-149]